MRVPATRRAGTATSGTGSGSASSNASRRPRTSGDARWRHTFRKARSSPALSRTNSTGSPPTTRAVNDPAAGISSTMPAHTQSRLEDRRALALVELRVAVCRRRQRLGLPDSGRVGDLAKCHGSRLRRRTCRQKPARGDSRRRRTASPILSLKARMCDSINAAARSPSPATSAAWIARCSSIT